MRAVATHRVYDAEKREILAKQVVELDERGYVTRVYPLTEEVRHTEWLGDLIVLYPQQLPEILPLERFSQYKERITSQLDTPRKGERKKAYLLTPFNVSEMEFTPDTHIVVC